jgi:ribosomal protein L18
MAKCFRKNTKFRILVRKTNRYFYASLISPDGKMIFSKSTFSCRSDNDKSYNCKSSSYIESLAKDFSDYIREKNLISSVFYDRGGNIYCGIVKNFADCLRANDVKI